MNLDLQSAQPAWLAIPSPRFAMGEGIAPLLPLLEDKHLPRSGKFACG